MIEVRVNLTARAKTREVAWLEVKDGCNNLSDVTDNDREAEIDSLNMRLVEFDIQT